MENIIWLIRFLPFVVIILAMYIILPYIRSRKYKKHVAMQKKAHEDLISSVVVGDFVLLAGGEVANVVSVNSGYIEVRFMGSSESCLYTNDCVLKICEDLHINLKQKFI